MASFLIHWDLPRSDEPLTLVGRATPCAPFEGLGIGGGAHGVTRPTLRLVEKETITPTHPLDFEGKQRPASNVLPAI